jgi:hypothetical protein
MTFILILDDFSDFSSLRAPVRGAAIQAVLLIHVLPRCARNDE